MKKIAFFLCCVMALGMLFTACDSQPSENTKSTTVPTTELQPVTVQELQIVCMPNKTKYLNGEDFDATGLVINAVMSDGTIQENVEWVLQENLHLSSNISYVNVSYQGKTVQIPVLVRHPGNLDAYSVSSFPTMENSPVKGNTYYWLGSSVTLGASAMNESMADFFAKKHDCICIKNAVSGTTLANQNGNSYVARFDAYLQSDQKAEHMDAVIVQLSTNDQLMESFGEITADDVRDPGAFDTTTTFGAIEYIIATAKQTWGCPVLFYTNPPTGYESYMTMVLGLYDIAAKWDIEVIDLFMDLEFNNNPTEEQRKLWMSDKIHPTKAGYRDWWLPKFEDALMNLE